MTDSTLNAILRAAEALHDTARLFSLAQVEFFMDAAEAYGYERRRRDESAADPLSWAAGWSAGYRARCAEENAAYPPEPMRLASTVRQDAVRVHRSRAGVDVVAPREGDFQGLGMAAVERLREEWAA